MTLKVNLSEITNLVKRGRQAVIDQALLADIMSLDANVAGDAFIYADAFSH